MVDGSSLSPVVRRGGDVAPSGGDGSAVNVVLSPPAVGGMWEVNPTIAIFPPTVVAVGEVDPSITEVETEVFGQAPPSISGGSEVSASSGYWLKSTGPRRMGVDVVGGEILLFVGIIAVKCVRVEDADPVATTSVQEESVASPEPAVLDVGPA